MNYNSNDFEQRLYLSVVATLAARGTTAIQFFSENPGRSKKELAAVLGGGVTARGLTRKLFEEARASNCLEQVAKDLLFRTILQEFPDGWSVDDKIATSVKLGSWYSDIIDFFPEYEETAIKIIRSFERNAPPFGWLPKSLDDF